MPPELIPIVGMGTGVAIFGTIAWLIVESKKAALGKVQPRELVQMDERLHRIEQAIDAMAVEVERISEGQRFTTKLLADRLKEPSALPAGQSNEPA
jgi:hypothetical protein